MKIRDDLQQNTDEWLKWRQGRVTAGDVSSIVGVSPFKSAYSVWLDKLGAGKPIEENANIIRGRELEPIARKLLSEQLGADFEPIVAESTEHSWLGASLDGYFENGPVKWICELKAGGASSHEKTKAGFMPDMYIYQCQTQLLVTRADLCFFANYFDGELAIIEVRPDAEIQGKIIKETAAFWTKNVLGYEAPAMAAGDYLDRNDVEFQNLSHFCKLAKERVEEAMSIQDDLKEKLLALANGQNVRGFGLEISHTPRRGLVDYKHQNVIAALSGLNLDDYRKPTTMVSTIRIKK